MDAVILLLVERILQDAEFLKMREREHVFPTGTPDIRINENAAHTPEMTTDKSRTRDDRKNRKNGATERWAVIKPHLRNIFISYNIMMIKY